jgi:hypothetical protein
MSNLRTTQSSLAMSRLDLFILKAESSPAPTSGSDRLDLLVTICKQVRTNVEQSSSEAVYGSAGRFQITNPHEQAARAAKVIALVATLRSGQITAELARTMDGSDWICAAKAAGVNPPSLTTCLMVIDSLAHSERVMTAGGSR